VTSEQNPDGIGEIITKRPRVDYLSIPLLAKFRFETSVLTPYLIAGPRYDVLLGRHGEGFQAVIDDFRRTEFGATIGAGVELRALFPFDALIEFRYNASFERAYKTNYLSVRNRTLDLMLGLSI
jgi:hypothetical protein